MLAQIETQEELLAELWIDGRAIGKARPRFGNNGSIRTADRYKKYKDWAIYSLRTQVKSLPKAPKPVKVECLFCNFLSSDTDNLQGSILDALVQVGYLENDSSSFVSSCSGEFVRIRKVKKQPKLQGVLVRVLKTEIIQISSFKILQIMNQHPGIELRK